MVKKVKINRAPVLTLWAAVVAERLGYDADTALTLAKAVAGMNAQSKGRRLGIYSEPDERASKGKSEKERGEEGRVRRPELLGRAVPAVDTERGLRATDKSGPIDPKNVQRYLERKLGPNLEDVKTAMEELAQAYKPAQLAEKAYSLYERFRPTVPEGTRGWGAAGELDLDLIRSLADQDS